MSALFDDGSSRFILVPPRRAIGDERVRAVIRCVDVLDVVDILQVHVVLVALPESEVAVLFVDDEIKHGLRR